MKKTALLLSFACSQAFASEVTFTENRIPFECKNARPETAQTQLQRQCSLLGQKLIHFEAVKCMEDGGDGGYVNYVAVTFVGICQ